ncbi:MAG: hypothetical protein ACTSO7_07195 [Candidatus Heimdallarchaeota archaeon]
MKHRKTIASRKIHLLLVLLLSCFIIQPNLGLGIVEITPFGENHITSSCTIFTISIDDTVYFGNNEDYKLENAYLWYVPNQTILTSSSGYKDIYGAVFLGFDNNDDVDVDTWEQGGMNEFGLCFDANGLPDTDLNVDGLYPYTPHALAQVLWDCKTVEDVITWYQNHKWATMGGQIHYADSTGDAIVVSANATGKWAFSRINSTFLVSTNFNLANHANGLYPCSRYTTANQMLAEITTEDELTVPTCANVLYAVHQEGEYGTKYSNIFDPVNLELYFNYGINYSEQEKINLMDKLTDLDSFEEKSSFLGVWGADGSILVKTEKTSILLNTNPVGINIGFVAGVLVLVITIFVSIGNKKRKNF